MGLRTRCPWRQGADSDDWGREFSENHEIGAVRSLLPQEATDLQTWHKNNVKKVRAFLLLLTKQKPRRKHRTVFSVARLSRPRSNDLMS